MKKRIAAYSRNEAGTLVLCMIAIGVLTFAAALTVQRIGPRFRMAYQTAAWQEARLAAEAGIDVALAELSHNATGASGGDWPGWKQQPTSGILGPAVSNTLTTIRALLGPEARTSERIFLDNYKVSGAAGATSEVDVQLWAVYPNATTNGRWFRIRSMATCSLTNPAYLAPDSADGALRRYSLRHVRPQLSKNDVGNRMTIAAPSASRSIEVLVEPILPFELAIFANQALGLSLSGTWCVDSYDSRDPLKSNPDGTYPGRTSPKVRENGNIASNLGRPADSLYGPLIQAHGTRVRGAVATNGGDDPATPEQENIADGAGIEATRVRDDFFREMKPMARPSTGLFLPPPILGLPFVAGPEAAPTQYLVGGNLRAFSVAAPPAGTQGAIIIAVNGNLDVSWGSITIPPNVTAQIFVRGDINLQNRPINSDASSSSRAAALQIYGEDSHGNPRTLRASGDAVIYAAFYGPDYDLKLNGDVEWCGAVVGRSFEILDGGSGGLHYDEALAPVGAPAAFRIARYVEDIPGVKENNLTRQQARRRRRDCGRPRRCRCGRRSARICARAATARDRRPARASRGASIRSR